VALLAFCGVLAAACRKGDGGPAPTPPNVIVIVVDTLRADHLSFDGYARPTSPRLAEWAAKGAYFERFYSHSAWTRPSVATILTGLLPTSHGIIDSGDGLNPRNPYLPRELRAQGYDTAALVTNPQLHSALGFSLGFMHYEEKYPKTIRPLAVQPADLELASAAGPLLAAARKRVAAMRSPYFLYLHLLDPHGPYTPPPAFAARFVDPAYAGRISGALADFANLSGRKARAADVAQFTALYDAEIASTDAELGGFLDWLHAEDQLDRTHVFVTADHGEELLDHGGTGHGGRLYEEQVRIPLLWLGPGVPAGRRVATLAGLADLAPTVRRLAGLRPREARDAAGIDLARVLRGDPGAGLGERGIFLEEPAPPAPQGSKPNDSLILRGLVTAGRKLIAEVEPLAATHCIRLSEFDLLGDPRELVPRTVECGFRGGAEDPAATAFNRHLALQNLQARHGAPEARLDAETEAQLKALGYL
jgi:arylsulfatase A-like enzyme